jgi:parvulin-like peptidyl-prolyl isomerase
MRAIPTIIISLSVLIFSFCTSKEQISTKVIVKVGSEPLTVEQLKKEILVQSPKVLSTEQLQNMLQQWIEKELMYQEALRRGMKDEKVLQEVFKQAERDFLSNALLDTLLSKETTISDQEIYDYYEKNKESFIRSKTLVKVQQILVDNFVDAERTRDRIVDKGADFVEVAKEISLDYKKNQRIELDYFSDENVVPEIAKTLFTYRIGDVTSPIKSEFGYHIFYVVDKRPSGEVATIDEVSDKISSRLISEKRKEIYRNFINDLKSKSEVSTHYELLSELYPDSLHTKNMIKIDSLK